jgi:hypothetical protein
MTTRIISVPPSSDNGGDKQKQQKHKNQGLPVEPEAYRNTGQYVKHSNAKEMIRRLLTCERVVSVPTRVRSFTISELAKELDVAQVHLKQLTPEFYKQRAWKINPPLIKLYCSTKFYEPRR